MVDIRRSEDVIANLSSSGMNSNQNQESNKYPSNHCYFCTELSCTNCLVRSLATGARMKVSTAYRFSRIRKSWRIAKRLSSLCLNYFTKPDQILNTTAKYDNVHCSHLLVLSTRKMLKSYRNRNLEQQPIMSTTARAMHCKSITVV